MTMQRKFLMSFLLAFLLMQGCHRAPLRTASNAQKSKIQGAVYFGFNRWDLNSEQSEVIRDKVALLKKYKLATVILEGHTDLAGPDDYNLRLGDLRARKVKADLAQAGIDPRRVVVVSFGETKPAKKGRSRAADAANRRVEFRIK